MVSRPPVAAPARARSRRLWLLLGLDLLVLLLLTSCYLFGDESTWIRVQNVGDEDASFSVELFNAGGGLIGEHVCPSRECPALAPGAAFTIPFEDVSSFPEGVLGSAVVTSSQPVIVLMASDIDRGERRFQSGGDTLSTGSSGGHLYLPVVLRKAGPGADWNGRFALQNVSDDVVACATLVYIDRGDEIAWDPYDPTPPLPAARPAACPNGGLAIQPGASVFRDPSNLLPPAPFAGAVRIDLHTNAAGIPGAAQTVVATAGVWNDNSLHFGSYRALNDDELGHAVLLPLIEREADGVSSTQFQIQNRDPNLPARVTIRFHGLDYSQDPPRPVDMEHTITVQGTALCAQAEPNADCLAPGDDLPVGFRGWAVLGSSQPIGVVVSRLTFTPDTLGTYRGVPVEQAATKLYLPLVVKNARSPDRTGVRSFIRIQVADGGSARVTISYRGEGVSGRNVEVEMTVSGAQTIMTDVASLLPRGFVGSAVVESDRPIVAVAEVTTGDFVGDSSIMYNAVPGT